MEQEIRQVKTLIATSGLVALAYITGFFLSYAIFPDETRRTIMTGVFVMVGALAAIFLTVRRIWKGLK